MKIIWNNCGQRGHDEELRIVKCWKTWGGILRPERFFLDAAGLLKIRKKRSCKGVVLSDKDDFQ